MKDFFGLIFEVKEDWLIGVQFFMAGLMVLGFLSWIHHRFCKRIFLREKKIVWKTNGWVLVGAPDLVQQHWGGRLEVCDLKTRSTFRAYPSDRLQLSLYALLIKKVYGRKVLNVGKIRVHHKVTQEERWIDVFLMSESEVLDKVYKYHQVMAGNVIPMECESENFCKQCSFYQKKCFPKNMKNE